MTRTTLPEFVAAVQAFQNLQNQYLTQPSKRKTLRPLLAQAASDTDKIASRYHSETLKNNFNRTQDEFMGYILWTHYDQARDAFQAYKIQKNRTTKISLREAEYSLKNYVKKLAAHLEHHP